jgi:hypothetical protein
MFLNKWWQSHPSFDPSSKPYKVLADELAEDPLYEVSVNNKNAVVVSLFLLHPPKCRISFIGCCSIACGSVC